MDTAKLIKDLQEALASKETSIILKTESKPVPFEIGKGYFIRTVTYHLTGKVVDIVGDFLVLDQASWIADSGRFNDAMKKGIDKNSESEIEPFEAKVYVNTTAIVDACEYAYSLNFTQK